MRAFNLPLFAIAVIVLNISLIGCDSGSVETPVHQVDGTPPPLVSGLDVGDHEGHDHSDGTCDAHPTEGPHGGHLIELGNEEYHAELLHDESTHRVTIHLLDGAGKEPVAAPLQEITMQLLRDGQFVQYTLTAVPSQGGDGASQFEVVDESLCDALCHEDELKGRLQVTLNGQPYTGTIDHTGHEEHEGHDDDGDHAKDGHSDH